MHSRRHFRGHLTVAAIAALGLIVAASHAAAQSAFATVEYVPANSNPPVPAGLKVTCVKSADSGAAPSATCPIVKYQGITTWAYSYIDNRVSLALVSYDSSNNVIANVEKPGARYIFEAASSGRTETVLFVGQDKRYVTATWAELGPK
jgi:hypothetical protein